MCLGDCGILVHRVNGVVVDIKGDPDCPVSLGKICPKGLAGMMTLYDPSRVKTPIKRTNPEKGIGIDPGWEPISWDEVFDILVEKLGKLREDDPRKLVFSTFDTFTMREKMQPFANAFGTPNGYWVGYYCGQYLHSSMFLTNGTFHCDFDQEHVNYLVLFGNQHGFMAGLNPNIAAQKMAEARKRGMKLVAVDPVCGTAGSKADEWVPIRPGTDAALVLSMINVLVNDLKIYDSSFIRRYTNGPYLVKPDGFYMRKDGKPQVWDVAAGQAKPYDAEVKEYAIEGSYSVDGIECTPAFQLLKAHVKKYTREMASEITTVPAATIRRVAEEFGKAAKIGSTIVVDGVELPYRPAVANIYRGAGAHKHGVAAALSILTLNMIVGSFYVPGGHRGMNLIGPNWEWEPGEFEGLVTTPNNLEVSHGVNYYTYEVKPPVTSNLKELFPISSNTAPMNLATSLDGKKWGLPYQPEILITSRRNLMMGGCDYKVTSDALKNYKFIVSFCIPLDEMREFADLVLPDSIYLEKLQTLPNKMQWSHTAQTGYFYWGVRQPVVEPVGEARDWGDVLVELADRMGFLGNVYEDLNKRFFLKEPFKLDPSQKYTWEEIDDRKLKSKFGDDKGLEWFKEHGYLSIKRNVDEMYPLPWLKVRFPLYYENVLEAGNRVKAVVDQMGLKDWDYSDYVALPEWRPCASHTPSGEFDLKVVNYRVPTHYQSWTAQNPWLSEVAELNPYAQKILINTQAAGRRGIKDKDTICVESSVGKVTGKAKVTECIHPEVVGISSHFGSYAKGKPVAFGKGANFNKLVPYDRDPVSTGVDACVLVKVYKV
jgi:molybdopterin-containing oxidoreductase family molybdopterin binding subunit